CRFYDGVLPVGGKVGRGCVVAGTCPAATAARADTIPTPARPARRSAPGVRSAWAAVPLKQAALTPLKGREKVGALPLMGREKVGALISRRPRPWRRRPPPRSDRAPRSRPAPGPIRSRG